MIITEGVKVKVRYLEHNGTVGTVVKVDPSAEHPYTVAVPREGTEEQDLLHLGTREVAPHEEPGMAKIVIDVVGRGRGTGYALAGKTEHPLSATQENRKWTVYAGTSDEFRGEGKTLKTAARRLAQSMGYAHGSAEICVEYRGQEPQLFAF